MRIMILLGTRWDMITKVCDKAKTAWPKHAWFVTQLLRTCSQTWRTRPTFALTLLEKADIVTGAPAVLTLPKASPKDVLEEGLQLRCNCKSCPLRPTDGAEPSPDDLMNSEILVEDRIPSQMESVKADLAEAVEDDGTMEVDDSGPGVFASLRPAADIGPQFVVELWPFAFLNAYWNTLYTGFWKQKRRR